ncbi:MAG: hypothetical protein WA913_00715 [Pricia sp.]
MKLDPKEKLALANVIDSVIQADGIVHPGEMSALGKLMDRFNFNGYDIEQARNLDTDQGLVTLNAMPYSKKKELAAILRELSIADNYMHENEIELVIEVLSTIGLDGETE